MTCSSLPIGLCEPNTTLPINLLDLVRLLARDAARIDFAARRAGEVTND